MFVYDFGSLEEVVRSSHRVIRFRSRARKHDASFGGRLILRPTVSR